MSSDPRESSAPGGGGAAGAGGGPAGGERELSDEEFRAAYEAELKRITVGDVVLQTVVSLINLGGRRMGLAPGSEDERDLDQVRDAIDSVRALMPVAERRGLPELGQIRDALSRLQMAYARAQEAASRPAPGGGQGEGGAAPPAGSAGGARSGGETAPAGKPEAPAGKPGKERPGDDQGRSPGPAESSGRLWVPGR